MTINERIGLVMLALRAGQKQSPEELNTAVEELASIIREEREPSKKILKRISEKYGINTEWLKSGTGDIFKSKFLANGKKSLANKFAVIEEEFRYKGDGNALMKSLMILDIVREGEPVSVKEALDILDDAKDILLEYKFI